MLADEDVSQQQFFVNFVPSWFNKGFPMIPVLLLSILIPQLLFANTIDSLLADNRVRAGVRAAELFDPIDNRAKYDSTLEGGFPLCDWVDYRWLLCNLPLADLGTMTKEDLFENVHLASKAVAEAPWASTLTQEHYFHYILPHRVSQEPFVHWRRQFKEEITPRLKGMTLKEAILEVNHWCHEKATYKPTDGRDQDPLTTIRSGFGRCEEEMILTICALRAVGIPARQCYTPYWAHSDDNHAWVEAWGGDGWYYLGACEPAQELNQAWFSGPAQRAMLVISTAYGDYAPEVTESGSPALSGGTKETGGDAGATFEPVLRRFGRSTLINSTAVYGPTKELAVKVVDKGGNPAPDVRVIFSLWNYGTLMPATSVVTDSSGVARLVCGVGDWFVSAQSSSLIPHPSSLRNGGVGGVNSTSIEDDLLFWVTGVPKKLRTKIASLFKGSPSTYMAFAHVKGAETEVTLKLNATTPAKWPTELEYTPPVAPVAKAPEVISAEGIARGLTSSDTKQLADSLFRARLAWEDSLREAEVWNVWARENSEKLIKFSESYVDNRGAVTHDTVYGVSFDTTFWHLQNFSEERISLFRKCRGNWGEIFSFLYLPGFPATWGEWEEGEEINPFHARSNPNNFFSCDTAINLLNDKDLRDFNFELLYEIPSLYSRALLSRDWPPDSTTQRAYRDYVWAPRIDYEPSLRWKWEVCNFLGSNRTLEKDDYLLTWLRDSITLESSPDRLGPPLTPEQCLKLRRGTESDVERLYIGLCRVRGIPARRNPVTGQVERWEMEDGKWKQEPGWLAVDVLQSQKPKAQRPGKKGKLTLTWRQPSTIDHQPSPIYMKDWAVASWQGNMADVMDFGWHEPFEKISWPQELPKGWYLISSGIRRQDGSAAVKLKWVQLKTMLNDELR